MEQEDSFKWIADLQYTEETADYGGNKRAVAEAVEDAHARMRTIIANKARLDKATAISNDAEERESLNSDYRILEVKFIHSGHFYCAPSSPLLLRGAPDYSTDTVSEFHTEAHRHLQATSRRRTECLKTLSEISNLENVFEPLWKTFAEKSVTMVKKTIATPSGSDSGGWTISTSQNCIEATKNAWKNVTTMMKCTEIHLEHSSSYHQFFADVEEFRHWMKKELSKADDLMRTPKTENQTAGDQSNIKKLIFEIKTALTLYLHWRDKTTTLWLRSLKILPVSLRLRRPDFELPVISLANYKTKEISVFEGEELTLLDNSQEHLWKLRNLRGDVNLVPSTFILIPGTDLDAVNAAISLRLQFLLNWTSMVKRAGKTVIRFLLKVIRDWTADEETMLRSLSADGRREVLLLLASIEDLFSPHWDPYPAYENLRTKMRTLRTLLEGEVQLKTGSEAKTDQGNLLVVQTESLVDLLARLKDFWQSWMQTKIAIETSRHPEYLLTVQSADQYRFLSVSEAIGKWQHSLLDFDEDDRDESDDAGWVKLKSAGSGLGQEAPGSNGAENAAKENGTSGGTEVENGAGGTGIKNGIGGRGAGEGDMKDGTWEETSGQRESEQCTIEKAEERAEASQLTTSEQEERQTFVITSVTDPRDGSQISLDSAVSQGIINQAEGKYVNPRSGESMPIPAAMNAGKIKVVLTTSKKSEEKKSDLGLITIRTYREFRPFAVTSVIDAKTEREMTVDAAVKAGILDLKRSIYKNLNTLEELTLGDALDSGLLKVEFEEHQDVIPSSSEVVAKTYAVHAVVDTLTSKRLTFAQSVTAGLINTDKGTYLNRSSATTCFIGDAIRLGFIKASVIKDPTSLQISADNIITLTDSTLQNFRRKLIRPLMAIYALRKAAEAAPKETAPLPA